jgi:hypothetical protein
MFCLKKCQTGKLNGHRRYFLAGNGKPVQYFPGTVWALSQISLMPALNGKEIINLLKISWFASFVVATTKFVSAITPLMLCRD